MRRMAGLWAALLLVLALTPVQAGAVELPIQAEAALLMEKETGQVLYAQNEHEALEPASVTKVMTLLLTMEAIEKGSLHYDDVVTVSAYAASMGGSHVYLSEGEQITVDDLLKAVCVASGNDAAVALAECVTGVTELFVDAAQVIAVAVSGSIPAFVEQMNQRAKELGMTDTHFVNCTGLPAEGHVTSAWDIALMSRELIEKHPDIRRYTTIWMDTLRDGTFQLANTNKLIRFYDGATGLKTGSTDSAKYCLSATAEREGMELIAVVLKSPTGQQRFEDAKALLNYGFSTYALLHTVPEEPFPAIPVVLGETETVQPCIDPQEAVALLQKSQVGGLSQSVTLAEQVEAPVSTGQELGTLTLTDAAGETVQSIPIRAAQSVERLTFGTMLRRMLSAAFFAG